jgi:hypothetical protein
MKYIICFFILLTLNGFIFSQQSGGNEIANGIYSFEISSSIEINEGEIVIGNSVQWPHGEIKGKYRTYSKDKYNYLEVSSYDERTYLFSYSVIEDILFLYSMTDGKCISASIKPVKGGISRLQNYYDFKTSSYLTEYIRDREYKYPPENLSSGQLNPPWVEGAKGDGIGEWVTFHYTEESRSFYIFNGYYDPKYPYLFTKNNRIKRFKLEAYSEFNRTEETFKYSQEFELEDTPQIQKIEIPRGYKYFKMIILDVYKGTHYEDTCLSGIFTDARWGM